ncbi:unnamed protein product, partial [Coregonus sp. 'balchen']
MSEELLRQLTACAIAQQETLDLLRSELADRPSPRDRRRPNNSALIPRLSEDDDAAYYDIEEGGAVDYERLKLEIQSLYQLNPRDRAQRFHAWKYAEEESPRGQLYQLIRLVSMLACGAGPGLACAGARKRNGLGGLPRFGILSNVPRLETETAVACIHGDTKRYPSAQVSFHTPAGKTTLIVGVVPQMKVPVLLGRDCPLFELLPGGEGDSPDDRLRHLFQETMEEDRSNQNPVLSPVDELQREQLRQVFQESSRESTWREYGTESSDPDQEHPLPHPNTHNFS